MIDTEASLGSAATGGTDAQRRATRSAVFDANSGEVRRHLMSWPAFGSQAAQLLTDPQEGCFFSFDLDGLKVLGTIYEVPDGRSQLVLDYLAPEGADAEQTVGAIAPRLDELSRSIAGRFGGEVFDPDNVGSGSLTRNTLEVLVTAKVAADPEAVWRLVGDRYGFRRWHPMISDSLDLHEGRHRRDMLEGLAEGGTLEKFLYHDVGKRTYAYAKVADDRIDHSWSATKARYFFPFSQYLAALAVCSGEGGCNVSWRGWLSLDPGVAGDSVEKARQQTQRFYRSGFQSLVERFGGEVEA